VMQSAGFQVSMSRKADCYDNAPMESFFHTLKTELVHHRQYMKAKPKVCSRTLRGSITSPKLRSYPASSSRATPNSSLPAKPWKASKHTASSQIPL